ncbi:MAG: hypothetical protein ACE5GA_05020, partial [Candidatus Zixiibacteriota bacterium]
DHSVFASGRRRRVIETEYAGTDIHGVRRYTLKQQPYFGAEFGLIVNTKDYPTNRTFSVSPRVIRFLVSDRIGTKEPEYRTMYELLIDSLSYSEGSLAACVYEQGMANLGDKSAYVMFQRDSLDGCFSSREWRWIGRFPDAIARGLSGVYPARIEVVDASGNISTVDFSFAFGPIRPLYQLTDIEDNSALVTPISRALLSDSLELFELQVVEFKPFGGWTQYRQADISKLKNGAYRITIADKSAAKRRRVFRLALKGRDGWGKADLIFTNAPLTSKTKIKLEHELSDRGLYVTTETSAPASVAPQIRALSASGRAIELRPVQIGARKFVAYMPPDTLLGAIVRLEAYRHSRDREAAFLVDDLHLAALSGDSGLTYRERATDVGTIFAPVGGLERPHLIHYGKAGGRKPQDRSIIAGPFEIGPQDFRYDYPVKIGMRPNTPYGPDVNIAICKLSKNKDKWDWFDTEHDDGVFWAETQETGVYALLIDNQAPVISRLRPGGKTPLKFRRPAVTAKIEDLLSGIWEDTLFDVRIDGEWLIPEYDAEDFMFRARPAADLATGEHELIFIVRDNAGNERQRREVFFVE